MRVWCVVCSVTVLPTVPGTPIEQGGGVKCHHVGRFNPRVYMQHHFWDYAYVFEALEGAPNVAKAVHANSVGRPVRLYGTGERAQRTESIRVGGGWPGGRSVPAPT